MDLKEIKIRLEKIRDAGWHGASHHHDGGVGNTLETLLKIAENNLSGPDIGSYELKTQRVNSKGRTSSLLTLKHVDPHPSKVVPRILIPTFGWQHTKRAADGPTDLSFRHTIRANRFTGRGFSARLSRLQNRLTLVFEPEAVDPRNGAWLESLRPKIENGLPDIYWNIDELVGAFQKKLNNCISVSAEFRINPSTGTEEYRYKRIQIMHGFNSDLALSAIDSGDIRIEFDAQTLKNHGTKFRIPRDLVPSVYTLTEEV
jgi:hypothetical protein